MPLLKKKNFERASLPEYLRDDEEVFHCEITNEIFRDYEEFCDRIILCNSMVWTCCMTGKSGLTYAEALKSEENAKECLKDFPTELRIPVLFLANRTKRTAFGDMADDVFLYVKDRLFIGENVEASFTGNKWRESHILQVIAPTEEQLKNLPKNGSIKGNIPASLFRYEVEQLDADDEDISEIMVVDVNQIRRKKGIYSREKNKLFLKQYVEVTDRGFWVIKESALEDYGINKMKFEQFFDGPIPDFSSSKRTKTAVNGKKPRQETLAQFLTKNNMVGGNKHNLMEQMKKREREFKQKKEDIKQKKAEEKLVEKQKRKEENVKISMHLRDWYKPKEDLELEDQKKLPTLTPVQLKVSSKYVGDLLMIVEFVNSFSKLLSTKDFFPNGLTVELMERALIEKEVAGPFTDIILMFLTALFNVQDEEASQYKTEVENATDVKEEDVDHISLTKATHLATLASRWTSTYQGLPLGRLPLYSLTASEILRLHLLASGARINENGARWRYQQRGGYTSEDDPGLYLRLHQPHILKSLSIHNVTQLPVGDKLKIISCLMDQLLTYADVRDIVEERLETSRQAKHDLRSIQTIERKREQEFTTARVKLKREKREDLKNLESEMEKLRKEAARKKAENDRKIEELTKTSSDNMITLGLDRAYRRYLRLESIPGLFVNFEEENPGSCLPSFVHQNQDLIGIGRAETLEHVRKLYEDSLNEKENGEIPTKINGARISFQGDDHDTFRELLLCSADPTNCVVHSTVADKEKWSFIYDREQFEELMNSLNKRGIRESELKQVLQTDREYLTNFLAQTSVSQLNPDVKVVESDLKPRKERKAAGKNKYEDANLGFPTDMDPVEVLHGTLIDNILEMEEKIHAGNLGSLKVKDRNLWREDLSSRCYEKLDKTIHKHDSGSKMEKIKKEGTGKSSRPNTPEIVVKEYRDPGRYLGATLDIEPEDLEPDSDVLLVPSDDQKISVQTLAIALVQVAQAVDAKYLKKPLGHADFKKEDHKKKEDFDVLDRWEQSLFAATSYSQVFLHYGTLDSCVMWSRSALLARCRVCRRQKDSENMLLCDSCNNGHHLYCLKPKLTSIPQGDWFCDKCLKEKEKEAKLLSPEPEQKKKRRVFVDEDADDCDEEDGELPSPEPDQKKKRRIFRDEDVEEDDEKADEDEERVEEIADEEGEEEEEEENGELENLEVCKACQSGGELLCCDKCPDMYHLDCLQPPLRRVPRGEWMCYRCKEKKPKNESDVECDKGEVAQRTGGINNQCRCAARARHKIHGFVKSLRRMSETEESDSGEEVSVSRRSNRRDIEVRNDLPLHNAALQELLADVMKHREGWPFIRPVQKTEVPDYYEVITKPMDFGTIKYKLNMGEYKCDADLMADAVLVFENCNTYNDSDALVYKCGVRLLKFFEKRCRELGLKLPEEMEEDEDADSSSPKAKKRRIK